MGGPAEVPAMMLAYAAGCPGGGEGTLEAEVAALRVEVAQLRQMVEAMKSRGEA